MADPLGLIGSGSSPGLGPAQSLRDGRAAGAQDGPSFKDTLLQSIEKVNRLQQEASTAAEDLMTGQRDDLEGVLLATQKADSAFRMLLAVRNKVQAAYEELKQVRI